MKAIYLIAVSVLIASCKNMNDEARTTKDTKQEVIDSMNQVAEKQRIIDSMKTEEANRNSKKEVVVVNQSSGTQTTAAPARKNGVVLLKVP